MNILFDNFDHQEDLFRQFWPSRESFSAILIIVKILLNNFDHQEDLVEQGELSLLLLFDLQFWSSWISCSTGLALSLTIKKILFDNVGHYEDLVEQGELSVTVGQQGDVMRKKANGSIIINWLWFWYKNCCRSHNHHNSGWLCISTTEGNGWVPASVTDEVIAHQRCLPIIKSMYC